MDLSVKASNNIKTQRPPCQNVKCLNYGSNHLFNCQLNNNTSSCADSKTNQVEVLNDIKIDEEVKYDKNDNSVKKPYHNVPNKADLNQKVKLNCKCDRSNCTWYGVYHQGECKIICADNLCKSKNDLTQSNEKLDANLEDSQEKPNPNEHCETSIITCGNLLLLILCLTIFICLSIFICLAIFIISSTTIISCIIFIILCAIIIGFIIFIVNPTTIIPWIIFFIICAVIIGFIIFIISSTTTISWIIFIIICAMIIGFIIFIVIVAMIICFIGSFIIL